MHLHPLAISIYTILFLFLVVFSSHLNAQEKSENYRVEIEAEDSDYTTYWRIRDYYTGISLKSSTDTEINALGQLGFEVNIPRPGEYNLWILGAVSRYDTTQTKSLTVETSGGAVTVAMNHLKALTWRHPAQDFPVKIRFDKPGKQRVQITAENVPRAQIVLDRFIITSDQTYVPHGYGYAEKGEIVLPPAWAFGVIYGGYTNQEETLGRVKRLVEEDYPIDAYWIDSWFWDYENKGAGPGGYIDFNGDTVAYPDMQGMWDEMRKKQIKSGIWIWNAILKDGNEAVFEKFLQNGYFEEEPHINTSGWHNSTENTLTGDVDFNNPQAVEFWKGLISPFFEKGVDFLKLDRNSHLSYLKAAFEATQELGKETRGRGYILSHLHSVYEPKTKLYPAKWTGDAKIAWNQPDYPNTVNYAMGAFKENIVMVSDPLRSTYEVPFLGNDTGGYNYFGSNDQSDELYMRWVQFSMFNPVTNVFSTYKNPTANMPYHFSEEAQDNFRFYSHLKMQLFPYIYSYAHRTRITGHKMIQGDPEYIYQYLFGNEILAAPVSTKGATAKDIALPEGKWFDFYNDKTYEGGRTINYEAPALKLPLLVREGAIIPMRAYQRTVELGTNDKLIVEVYPSSRASTFELYEDDGISNDYLEGKVAKTVFERKPRGNEGVDFIIRAVEGNYEGMNSERSFILNFHKQLRPSEVLLNGKSISSFEYEESEKVLSVKFSADKTVTHKIVIQQ